MGLSAANLVSHGIIHFVDSTSVCTFLSVRRTVTSTNLSPRTCRGGPHINLVTNSNNNSPHFRIFNTSTVHNPHNLGTINPCIIAGTVTSNISTYLTAPFGVRNIGCSVDSTYTASTRYVNGTMRRVRLNGRSVIFTNNNRRLY